MENNNAIRIDSLISWDSMKESRSNQSSVALKDNQSEEVPPFRVAKNINKKICVWNGPIWRLQVDAIVNSTNENLSETTGLCKKILDAAGKEIWTEFEEAGVCRTGEAISTRGCQLPARKIIHTVGPRYNLKYHNAAESALHQCYRSVMSVAKEEHLRTIALSCIYTRKKGYPRDEATHIAARTIRRFLEHYAEDFDYVIFCVDNLEDQSIYDTILPLYFPRTKEEEQKTTSLLTRSLGDAFGEPIIEERKIRINELFQPQKQQQKKQENQEQDHESTDEEAILDFCEMSIDPDMERLDKIRQAQEERERLNNQQQKQAMKYEAAIQKAKQENFDDLDALKFLYHGGVDHSGSQVMIYVAGNLPIHQVNLDRVMLYIIYKMDAIVDKQYSILYVHTSLENQPYASWFKRLFHTFGAKYQQNLKFFYILKPSIWLKVLIWMGQRFVHRGFYQKIVYLSTMDQLKNIANFTLDLSSVEALTDKKKNKKKKNEKKEKQPMQTTKIIEETDSAVLL